LMMGLGVIAMAAAMLFLLSLVATVAHALTRDGKNEKDNAG